MVKGLVMVLGMVKGEVLGVVKGEVVFLQPLNLEVNQVGGQIILTVLERIKM